MACQCRLHLSRGSSYALHERISGKIKALSGLADDDRLRQLDQGERNTDNLSPWPSVAAIGERMNYDEFMRRTLTLTTISESRRRDLAALGQVEGTLKRSVAGCPP